MTPAARIATAAEILDAVSDGMAAEQALTRWARGARFAGSKDRAAVRDHVFDALRRWRSAACAGGGTDGRRVMLGLLRLDGADPEEIFTGRGHAPPSLTEAERAGGSPPEGRAGWDMPDWIADRLERAHGVEAAARLAKALRERAPVTLRVNTLKSDVPSALGKLEADGISARPNPLCNTALTVTEGARRIAQGAAYRDGLVELQDAASQAVAALVPLTPEARVLDYCAGGGGKTLALAARMGGGPVVAHDADPRRMRDLPDRAARAGARVERVDHPDSLYHAVLTDAPCSGSGAWRRSPEAKWRLTPERLSELNSIQDDILDRAAELTAPAGTLVYATCSILAEENDARIDAFLARTTGWHAVLRRAFDPDVDGDGFFTAHLTRRNATT
jgi:16S rRNA (cytosine967-C5)-methyltransferase